MAGRPRFNTYTAIASDASGALSTGAAFSNLETSAQGPLGAYTQRLDFLQTATLAEVLANLNGENNYNAITYAATMTPDARYEVNAIIPTDTTAFTVANPSNDTYAATLTLRFLNSSGGTMGNVTFGSEYKIGASFDKPANGKVRYYTFRNTGSTWEESSRSAADVTP